MARQADRLSARKVATLGKAGLYADGAGLYLRVDAAGAKRWTFIYRWLGKRKEMGLGPLYTVSLADARIAAGNARKSVREGVDPVQERRARLAELRREVVTFGTVADEYVETHEVKFRSEKHRAQWAMTLGDAYCSTLRPVPIDQVELDHILAVLRPIWLEKPETASRLRGRIERVLDSATTARLRSGTNPAKWKGNLSTLLPKPEKLSRGHHAAMRYQDVPAFLARLGGVEGTGAAALHFTVLTVSRTGEAIGARAEEFDLDKKVWTVPAERMKAGREHRVPLVDEAVALVRRQMELSPSSFIFPGFKPRQPISSMTMTKALRAAGGIGTVHGLRSAFRDWVGEETQFPEQIAEAALAHIVGDETERAYRRGDALEKRRKLMEAWANFCLSTPGTKVVPLRQNRK